MSKNIKTLYKSSKVPTIDLEDKINKKLDQKPKKLNMRTLLVAAVIMTLTTMITFATVSIIKNNDRSRTLLDVESNKLFTLNMDDYTSPHDDEDQAAVDEVLQDVRYFKPEGDQARVVYYDYNSEKEPLFWVSAAEDKFQVTDDDYSVFLELKETPDYLEELVQVFEEDFEVLSGVYGYLIDDESKERLREESAAKSTFGEIYKALVPVEKELWSIKLKLLTKDIEKFHGTSLSIFNNSVFSSPGYDGSSFETVEVNNQAAMLSKRTNGAYILVAEINGYFINFEAKGEKEDMIQFVEKIIDVMEKY